MEAVTVTPPQLRVNTRATRQMGDVVRIKAMCKHMTSPPCVSIVTEAWASSPINSLAGITTSMYAESA